jgi:L-arabinonolactonase
MHATLLVDGQHSLGECVLWCGRTASVYWTDIHAATLWNLHPESGVLRHWSLPERLSCFALTNDDRYLLLGLASQLAYMDLTTEKITPIVTVEAHLPSTRLNDGRCDRAGRFVFGTLNEDTDRAPIGHFYRLNTDLSLEQLSLPAVAIPNSICFSVDGTRMYYCDSMKKQIRYCDYDAQGRIGEHHVFADLSMQPGAADGSIVDADGYVWNAQWGGSKVVRYAPDGHVDREIMLPVTQPSCVALGGVTGNTLFITTARENLTEDAVLLQPQSGGVFYATVADVKGLPEVRFGGALPSS